MFHRSVECDTEAIFSVQQSIFDEILTLSIVFREMS